MQNSKIQTRQNTKEQNTNYQNTNVTKYKCYKIQIKHSKTSTLAAIAAFGQVGGQGQIYTKFWSR